MASPQDPRSTPNHTAAARPLTWRYPFPARDGKEITDPQIFYDALGAMGDGYFPLGLNGFPHGGIHFGAASASRVDQSNGVHVIADGEIVAYRLDDAYPHLRYTQTRRWALYSTGFVLVRHRMTMPPAPGRTGTQPADETLTFFSLYLHMADWSTYLADGKLVRPGWWPGVDAFRIGGKDRQNGGGEAPGAFVRQEPKAGRKGHFTAGAPIAFLPQDSEVIIGETRGPWAHIKAITSGTMIAANAAGHFGREDGPQAPWVLPDGVTEATTPPTPEGDWGWIYLHEQQAVKEPTGIGTVVIPAEPIAIRAGTLLGQIGEYIDYETSAPLPPKPGRQLLHLEVFADETLQTFIEKSRARAAQLPPGDRSIFVIEAGTKLVEKPTDPDLKLGAAVPYVKLAVTASSPKTGPWVQVQEWIDSWGKPAPYQGPFWIARSDLSRIDSPSGLSAWKSFPLQMSQAASPVNATQVNYPRAELDSLGEWNVAVDDKGVIWWRLEVDTGSGKSARGWVCGGKRSDRGGTHPGTHWESSWAWPGFEIVDATGIDLVDAFKRNLSITGSANAEEQRAFAPSTEAVGKSELLLKLEQTVSRLRSYGGGKDERGKDGSATVTAVKRQRALRHRWLASELSHVILKYESEWGGNLSRWEALTPIMRNAAENWTCELERIRKLQWWDSVKGKVEGFPASPVVNHIHPVAVVGNFFKTGNSLDTLIRKIGDIISRGEGGYESYNTGTNGPHGAVGHSYITRPAGTVTEKTINQILSSESLSYVDPARFYTTGKYQTIIPTLREGMKRLGLTGEEKYDENMQEKIFSDFLIYHAGGGGLARFIKQRIGTVDDAQYAASKEWASIAAPSGLPIKNGTISDGTLSYYESSANRANMNSTNRL
jgi:hypothetical protein